HCGGVVAQPALRASQSIRGRRRQLVALPVAGVPECLIVLRAGRGEFGRFEQTIALLEQRANVPRRGRRLKSSNGTRVARGTSEHDHAQQGQGSPVHRLRSVKRYSVPVGLTLKVYLPARTRRTGTATVSVLYAPCRNWSPCQTSVPSAAIMSTVKER